MTSATASSPPPESESYRVLVTSVGQAGPAAAAAVASGLGIPAQTVISRLYRAPTTLVDGISSAQAQQLSDLLAQIGYEARPEPASTPAPEPGELFDVSAYLADARQFGEACKRLADFIGAKPVQAAELLLKPPAIVLGSVSAATVSAFETVMGETVCVRKSATEKALYAVFLMAEQDGNLFVYQQVKQQIMQSLGSLDNDSGLVAMDVPHDKARGLWQKLQATGLVRIVNQDFLRFDIVLGSPPGEVGSDTVRVLREAAGIPEELVAKVLQSAPIRLCESVINHDLPSKLECLVAAGLDVVAELVTFQMLGIRILSYQSLDQVTRTLRGYGVDIQPGHRPIELPMKLPETRARVLLETLRDEGCDVELVE